MQVMVITKYDQRGGYYTLFIPLMLGNCLVTVGNFLHSNALDGRDTPPRMINKYSQYAE